MTRQLEEVSRSTQIGTTRIAPLDGLRALAVLPVIAAHSHLSWMPGGGLGVDVFFVLSGFLITSLLIEESARTGRVDLRAFWLRRLIRLGPALLIVVLIVDAVMVLAILTGGGEGAWTTLSSTPSILFYFSNWLIVWTQSPALGWFGPLWSLSVEEQFYLVWPLLVIAGARRSARGLIVAAMIWTTAVVYRSLTFDGTDKYATFATHFRVDALMVGCMLAFLVAGSRKDQLAALARVAAWPSILLLALFTVIGPDFNGASPEENRLYYVVWLPVLGLAAAALIAHFVLNPPKLLANIFSAKLLVYLGTISYGLYLWHYPIINVVSRLTNLDGLMLFVLVTAVTIAAAALSWRYVERPISRQLRARWVALPA